MIHQTKNVLLNALMLAGVFPLCSAVAAESAQGATSLTQEIAAQSQDGASKENAEKRRPVRYSYIGVALETLPAATFCENARPGIQVVKVIKNSPASASELQNGDILITLDGQKLFFPNQFSSLVRSYKPGSTVELTLMRGEEKLKKSVVIGQRLLAAGKSCAQTKPLSKDDIRIYINGREISLADGSDISDCISLTPDGILIRDRFDVPAEFRRLVSRAHESIPNAQRSLSFLRQQYEDARKSALGKMQQSFSQVFFGQGNSVIIVGDEKGRQVTVSRPCDDSILFRGACTTQADIDAIPQEAKKIIDSFTILKPMKMVAEAKGENTTIAVPVSVGAEHR